MKKIFGIGLSRTGTTSLTLALNKIGIKIIHYPDKKELFDPNNDGACDIPVIANYKKLDIMFPNSKFVYTIREKEDWLESMKKYLENRKIYRLGEWHRQNRLAVYGQVDFDRNIFAKIYDTHDKDVKTYFKKRSQDLLIINICAGDGLELLLSFLNIPTNEDDYLKFPHEHKRNNSNG